VKPIISWAIEVVLPLFYSCLKLKTRDLAAPRPSSRVPGEDDRIEVKVLFPASTFPKIATRIFSLILLIVTNFSSSSIGTYLKSYIILV
jgi:hypothetical protein